MALFSRTQRTCTTSEPERVYTGNLWQQLKLIRQEGRVVAPTAYFMLERLEGRKGNLFYDVGDFIAEHPDGSYQIVLAAFSHPEFLNWGEMQGREFVLHERVYETLPGITVANRANINRDYTLEEALASRIWNVLARHPDVVGVERGWAPQLLNEYARRMVFPHHECALGVFLSEVPRKSRLRAACVDGLEVGSQFDGGYFLDDGNWRVVGLAPEALEQARLRSFSVCEQLAGVAYPVLKRDAVRMAAETSSGGAREEEFRVGQGQQEDTAPVVSTMPCELFPNPFALIEPFTEEELAQRKAEMEKNVTEERLWRE